MGENQIIEEIDAATIETENVDVEIADAGDAVVVVVDPEPSPVESGATISQLVETIATLTDSIQALRLQIENERNQNFEAVMSRISDLESNLSELLKIEKSEHGAGEEIGEKIAESVKPRSRWLTGRR